MTAPGEPTSVGAIIGYLRLDRSDWDAQISAAQRRADELGRSNPTIRIQTNSRDAIAQLAAVAAAARGLQDAQGQAGLAQQRLTELQASGRASATQLRAAEERVAATSRQVEDAQIRLASAYQRQEDEARRAAAAQFDFGNATDRAGSSADRAKKPIISLVGALALIAPAALPIAAVAGGAMAGLIPTAASLALGIAGITGEMKSGALQGTRYGRDINQLKGEFSDLKAIAAGGLLSGLDKTLGSSHPLFRVLNSDTQVMSTQIGDVAAHAAPALLQILNDLNPLFVTFGNLMVRGATELEHWARSSTGVSSFVGYVQKELPAVMHFLGNLVVLFAHVAEAGAPFGGTLLTGINLVVDALDHIPVSVLQVLVPLLVAARVAMLGYRGINAIITPLAGTWKNLSTQVKAYGDRTDAVGLQLRAAALRNEASAAEEARVTSLARAQQAEASVVAAREQVAAAEQVGEAEANEARAVLDAKTEEAAAARAAAGAAIVSARETAAASEGMAARVVASGAEAEAGWTAALGPIGGLLLAGGLLATMFLGQAHDTQVATQANQNYADSVKQSTDALDKANLAATAKSLSDAGALDQLDQLHRSNTVLFADYGDLTRAVNGNQSQFDQLIGSLRNVASANKDVSYSAGKAGAVQGYNATGQAANALAQNLRTLRASLHGNIQTQTALDHAQQQSIQLSNQGGTAAQAMARKLGVTGTAYLAARTAAAKNTAQTRQQTLAFQLENDAASILQAALDKLAGKGLSMASAQTALHAANLQVEQSFKTNKTVVDGASQAAVNNQQSLQQQAQAAIQVAEQVGKATGSNRDEAASLRESKTALEQQLAAHDRLTPAVQTYIDKLYSLRQISGYLNAHPTKLDVNTAAAIAQVRALNTALAELKNNELSVGGYVNVKHALSLPGRASGGGAPEGLYWTGEGGPELNYKRGSDVQVIPAGPSRTLADAMGIRVPGFAAGTSNAARIWDYLLRAGLSPREDAGVMGNLERESGFDPTASNGTHFGIAQWDAGRWANVVAIANRMGVSQWTLAPQLENLVRELHGPYRSVLTAMNHARSAARAAGIFNHQFEVSGDYGGVRAGYAADLLQRFRGTGPGAGGGGTGGGGGTRKQHPLHDARAGFRSTQHPHQVFAADGQWWYNGQSYATRALADEAKREDQITRGEQTVQRTIRKGGATGIAQLIRSQIPDSQQAMRDLGKAVDAAFDLKHVKTEIADARSELHNMLGYRGQVESTYAGMFDPTQYGTIGGLVKGLMGAAGANNGIAAEISKLRHEHLNKAYLSKLVSSGDTSTIALLAGGSQAQINQVDKALGKYGSSLTRIGNSAVRQRFDESVVRERHEITHLLGKQGRLMDKIERLTDAVTRLDKRPTIIELDGQPIYRSTNRKLAKKLHRHRGRHG